jgi:DNA (cytosine-5)-methyltransferase 1
MRNASKGKHPTFAVWENVPGALSSKGGEDFRIVLEELCRIADGSVSVPRPPRGKWTSAGEILGDGFSLAWRVLDAEFWGVPQRRRRIFLVVDFGGGRAGEILFESEGLPRDIAPGGEEGESPAAGAGSGAARANGFNGWKSVSGSVQYAEECAPTIEAAMPPNVLHPRIARAECPAVTGTVGVHQNQNGDVSVSETAYTLSTSSNSSARQAPLVLHPKVAGTLCASGAGLNRPARQGNETDFCVVMGESSFGGYKEGRVSALKASGGALGGGSENLIATGRRVVRRFTPRECERLMGLMPDDYTRYTDTGRELADTPRYKMLGNGVAIPCAEYVMRGIANAMNDSERR